MEKSIYDLELNEKVKHIDKGSSGKTIIRRVPGGWIYNYFHPKGMTSCFVPYDQEFAPKKEVTVVRPR